MGGNSGAWKIEKLHTLYSLMFFGWAFKGLTTPNPMLANLSWACMVGPSLIFSLRNPGRTARAFFLREPLILVFIGLAMASFGWSLLPMLTLSRSLQMLVTFHYACYLSVRYSWAELLDLTRLALRWAILFSLAMTVVRPDLCIHVADIQAGQWKGLFGHKNHSGRVACLLCSISLVSLVTGLSRSIWLVLLDFGLGVLVLKMAGSRTAIGVLVIVMAIIALLRMLIQASSGLRLSTLFLSVTGLALFIPISPLLYAVVAQADWNDFLTGRVTLWRTVFYYVARHPWSGYGYGVFFQDAAFGRLILLAEGWPAPHSHNVLLELAADLGLLAVALYLLIMARFHWRALRRLGTASLVAITVSTFNILTGLTETACFPDVEIGTLLFMVMAVTLSRLDVRPFSRREVPVAVVGLATERNADPPATG